MSAASSESNGAKPSSAGSPTVVVGSNDDVGADDGGDVGADFGVNAGSVAVGAGT